MSFIDKIRQRLKQYGWIVKPYRYLRYTLIVIIKRVLWDIKFYFYHQRQKEVLPCIVSFTSFPKRIKYVKYTLQSLLMQTKQPQEIILWLAEEQFPNKKLPRSLLKTIERKGGGQIKIKWCEDLRSYKKLLPTLKLYPHLPIITTDDDIYYPKNWLETLWESYLNSPNCISTHHAMEVCFKISSNSWIVTKNSHSSLKYLAVGFSGVLYPPKSLHHDIFDYQKIKQLAPIGDDLYFWAMAILVGTKTIVPKNALNNFQKSISHYESPNLGDLNGLGGQNDIQIQQILNHYPQIKILLEDH